MKPLLIIGGSSFSRLIRVLAEESGRTVAGCLDDFNTGEGIVGRTNELGSSISPNDFDLAMAIGYRHMDARMTMFRHLRALGFEFPSITHPRARISPYASVGTGSLVMASVDVDAFTRVGDLCVLWPHVTISHDSTIGEGTFVSPAATLCGFVSVGDLSFIGANSTVVDGSALPPRSFVKAASRHHNRVLST